VVKTTVYLPDELKRRLEQTARRQKRSEADVIREALQRFTDSQERPKPRLPLFSSGEVDPIEDWDGAMRGFGER
jgi:Arc/MetJ-type ribon-helix-helix transcriptional regulator